MINVNKAEINDRWYTFLQLAAEAKMRNSGLSETSSKNSATVVIEKKSPQVESKNYLPLYVLNNNRYVNTENNKNNNKILGTKFDAYA
ncbi:MAG: hypothetical protein N2053_02995 [Chitinispirillaceae bacterium]|nr:hypothetical protein [Chitinispirillaceae bacterium]